MHQASSFLPKGNIKRVCQTMAGTETGGGGHADLLLQSCVQGVDKDIQGSVAIHLVFFLGRRAMSVAVSLRWKFLQCGHYVGTENDHCGQERGAWRRIGRAQSSMGSGSAWTGGGLGRAQTRLSGWVWFGFLNLCIGRPGGGRPWPRLGSAGVWTESWNGRSREQARAGGSGVSQRVKSREVSLDSKSGVREGWGPRAVGWQVGAEVGSHS